MTNHSKTISLTLIFLFAGLLRASPQSAETKPIETRTPRGNRVWIYLPKRASTNDLLACVLVPPAGSPLIHGMALAEEDRVEQTPYVDAGFAVVSFDISGPLAAPKDPKELKAAMQSFRNADCGIKDAFEALALAQAKYPQLDRNRVYVAGHSSAGTLALQIASSTNLVRACIAFAPICDLEQRLGQSNLMLFDQVVPGMARTLREASPKNRIASFNCPVFLFHSMDDENVKPAAVIAFKNALLAKRVKVEYVVVNSGGHYDSMIKQGIPKAVEWLKRIDGAAIK